MHGVAQGDLDDRKVCEDRCRQVSVPHIDSAREVFVLGGGAEKRRIAGSRDSTVERAGAANFGLLGCFRQWTRLLDSSIMWLEVPGLRLSGHEP
ncbi:MAG: hypothetical protein QOJ56_377 [Mycobacterium sp.]|nr:hypothetical protein [Mycobacterium sp.]